MITLQKKPNKDFIVLNLSDPQLSDKDWAEDGEKRNILTNTVNELVGRVRPDLITVSGDLSWAENYDAYEKLGDFLDSFCLPWAPIWGNHDNQGGREAVEQVVSSYLKRKHCIYERGDKALGNGNYVIAIEQEGRVVEGIIMMDSHDRAPFHNAEGEKVKAWAKLIPEQLVWYREQIMMLKNIGCEDTTLIFHIPIYAYRTAYRAALRNYIAPGKEAVIRPEDWKEEYADSQGVCHEGIASYPADEGMFAMIKELNSTHHVICGHDHINNTIIKYQGVKLIYSLKTGAGCYWEAELNGGTVLNVTENGVTGARHEFVTVK